MTTNVSIQALDLVQLQVNDWPAAVRWYQDKLGFQVLVQEETDRIAFLSLEGDACKLAIWGTGDVDGNARSRCYPCLRVGDLDATIASLKSLNVETTGKIEGGAEQGFRGARILDCERNTVFLYEWVRK